MGVPSAPEYEPESYADAARRSHELHYDKTVVDPSLAKMLEYAHDSVYAAERGDEYAAATYFANLMRSAVEAGRLLGVHGLSKEAQVEAALSLLKDIETMPEFREEARKAMLVIGPMSVSATEIYEVDRDAPQSEYEEAREQAEIDAEALRALEARPATRSQSGVFGSSLDEPLGVAPTGTLMGGGLRAALYTARQMGAPFPDTVIAPAVLVGEFCYGAYQKGSALAQLREDPTVLVDLGFYSLQAYYASMLLPATGIRFAASAAFSMMKPAAPNSFDAFSMYRARFPNSADIIRQYETRRNVIQGDLALSVNSGIQSGLGLGDRATLDTVNHFKAKINMYDENKLQTFFGIGYPGIAGDLEAFTRRVLDPKHIEDFRHWELMAGVAAGGAAACVGARMVWHKARRESARTRSGGAGGGDVINIRHAIIARADEIKPANSGLGKRIKDVVAIIVNEARTAGSARLTTLERLFDDLHQLAMLEQGPPRRQRLTKNMEKKLKRLEVDLGLADLEEGETQASLPSGSVVAEVFAAHSKMKALRLAQA